MKPSQQDATDLEIIDVSSPWNFGSSLALLRLSSSPINLSTIFLMLFVSLYLLSCLSLSCPFQCLFPRPYYPARRLGGWLSASRVADLGWIPACAVDLFTGSSRTSGLTIGTTVVTLQGAWHYRVSAGTGRAGASILWLGEMESWICSFYPSAASVSVWQHAHLSGQIRPWDTLAWCWDVKQPTNKLWLRCISKLNNHWIKYSCI